MARLTELDAIEETRALTTAEALEAMEIAWPGYFSSLEAAQPIPQRGHAPSKGKLGLDPRRAAVSLFTAPWV